MLIQKAFNKTVLEAMLSLTRWFAFRSCVHCAPVIWQALRTAWENSQDIVRPSMYDIFTTISPFRCVFRFLSLSSTSAYFSIEARTIGTQVQPRVQTVLSWWFAIQFFRAEKAIMAACRGMWRWTSNQKAPAVSKLRSLGNSYDQARQNNRIKTCRTPAASGFVASDSARRNSRAYFVTGSLCRVLFTNGTFNSNSDIRSGLGHFGTACAKLCSAMVIRRTIDMATLKLEIDPGAQEFHLAAERYLQM